MADTDEPDPPGRKRKAKRTSPPPAADFDALILAIFSHPRVQFEAKPREMPAERAARLEKESQDARHHRRMEWAVFGLLCAVVAGCLYTIASRGVSDERAKLAAGALATIVGAFTGYLAGKATK